MKNVDEAPPIPDGERRGAAAGEGNAEIAAESDCEGRIARRAGKGSGYGFGSGGFAGSLQGKGEDKDRWRYTVPAMYRPWVGMQGCTGVSKNKSLCFLTVLIK